MVMAYTINPFENKIIKNTFLSNDSDIRKRIGLLEV